MATLVEDLECRGNQPWWNFGGRPGLQTQSRKIMAKWTDHVASNTDKTAFKTAYSFKDNSTIARMVMESSGLLKHWIWSKEISGGATLACPIIYGVRWSFSKRYGYPPGPPRGILQCVHVKLGDVKPDVTCVASGQSNPLRERDGLSVDFAFDRPGPRPRRD
ncbi:hypothetical protein ACLOJK_029534 [Asimina triloba]